MPEHTPCYPIFVARVACRWPGASEVLVHSFHPLPATPGRQLDGPGYASAGTGPDPIALVGVLPPSRLLRFGLLVDGEPRPLSAYDLVVRAHAGDPGYILIAPGTVPGAAPGSTIPEESPADDREDAHAHVPSLPGAGPG